MNPVTLYYIMSKKEINKAKKIPKTGAERIRAYRARILAYEKEAAARSAANIEGVTNQTANQQKTDNHAIIRHNQDPQRFETFNGQNNQDQESKDIGRQAVQVDTHNQDLPLLSEVSSTTGTKSRRRTEIAKTQAERARAYRRRRKALNIAAKEPVILDEIDSQVGISTVVNQECEWTSGSSNMVYSTSIKIESHSEDSEEDSDNKETTQTTKRKTQNIEGAKKSKFEEDRVTDNSKEEKTDTSQDDCILYTKLLCKKLQALKDTTREIAMLEIDRYIYSLKQQEKSNLSLLKEKFIDSLVGQYSL